MRTRLRRAARLWWVGLVLALAACGGAAPTATPPPTPTPTAVAPVPLGFRVLAGGTYQVPWDVEAGTRIEFSFTSSADVDFRLADPVGNAVVKASRVFQYKGSLVADRLGRYTAEFDNRFSFLTPKDVSFTYRVVPPGGR